MQFEDKDDAFLVKELQFFGDPSGEVREELLPLTVTVEEGDKKRINLENIIRGVIVQIF